MGGSVGVVSRANLARRGTGVDGTVRIRIGGVILNPDPRKGLRKKVAWYVLVLPTTEETLLLFGILKKELTLW